MPGIQTLYDSGASYSIPAQYDGAVYNVAVPDCICKNVGDEFTMQSSAESLYVTFKAGSEAVIGGAFFKIEQDYSVLLDANNSEGLYICARIALGNEDGEKGSIIALTSESSIMKGNLNGSSSDDNVLVRDLLLYVVTTNSTGVVNVTDKRITYGNGGVSIKLWNNSGNKDILMFAKDDGAVFNFRVLEQSEYDALNPPTAHTMYFIKES